MPLPLADVSRNAPTLDDVLLADFLIGMLLSRLGANSVTHRNNPTRQALTHGLLWSCSGNHRLTEVLDPQRVLVVRAGNVVAKLVGVLGLDAAAHVAAAQEDLSAPDAPSAALREDVVFSAKEKLCDEGSADPIVPRARRHWQRAAPDGTDVLHIVRVVHVQPRQRRTALDARDLPHVDPGAIGARRAVELPLAAELARCGHQRTEELCLVLDLGVPNKRGPVRFAEALAHPALVPNAGLGLREQRTPPLGCALAAHALHCGACRADVLRRASTEAEEWQHLSTIHGRVSHLPALPKMLAFGRAWVWNAAFCFLAFAFVLGVLAFVLGVLVGSLGLAFGSMGLSTSGRAHGEKCSLLALQLGGCDAKCKCSYLLVQKLLHLIVTVGVFGANCWRTRWWCAVGLSLVEVAIGVCAASGKSSSRWAHFRRSSTASLRNTASLKTAFRLPMTCLILARLGGCGASNLASDLTQSRPPSAPRLPGAPSAMAASTPTGPVKRRTAPSDMAPLVLHGRHLNEVYASNVGEFTAAIADSSIDKILLAAGTYELTSDMCTGSAVCISRTLTIEAEVPGAVVLNAMGARRVFNIQSGGTVDLIGLNITGGYANGVHSACPFELSEPSATFPPSPR